MKDMDKSFFICLKNYHTISGQCKFLYRIKWSYIYRELLQSKSYDMANSYYAHFHKDKTEFIDGDVNITMSDIPSLAEVYDSIIDFIYTYPLSAKQSIIQGNEVRKKVKELSIEYSIDINLKDFFLILSYYNIPIHDNNIHVCVYWLSKDKIDNGMILSYRQSHKKYPINIIYDNDYPIYKQIWEKQTHRIGDKKCLLNAM